MKNLKFFSLILLIFFVASCSKDLVDAPDQSTDNDVVLKSSSSKVKIAVLTDIHCLIPSLMPYDYRTNSYFQASVSRDRKLIELSYPIFMKAVSELIEEKPDVLLITGDIPRAGEKIGHETVAGILQQIENEGTKVYVIPGNNDILSSDSQNFKNEPPTPVANVTQTEYTEIYANFGYNEALYRDVNSLSYICQPCANLWVLGIDACKYTLTSGKYKVSAVLNPATLAWIEEKMAEARENDITVLAMMHYDILEHYTGQGGLEAGIIKDNILNANALMNAGINLIFTGHLHANDIVQYTNEGKMLTEIETGGLVTPMCPYRVMTLDDNYLKIQTNRITSIDAELPGGIDFLTYSDSIFTSRLNSMFTYYMKVLFGRTQEEAEALAPYWARAFQSYFAGDEKLWPAERKSLKILAETTPSVIMNYLNSVWIDLPPKDNNIHIKLK